MTQESTPNPDLTVLLRRVSGGDEAAAGELLPLVYEQLRVIARARMAGERSEHTLQATALVHEAYVRMLGTGESAFENRKHFFFAATEAMRRILIDHARARKTIKRGGPNRRRISMDISAIADLADDTKFDEIIALDEALQRLENERPRVARVVKLRFYGGMSIDQTAEMLEVSARTVDLDWAFARAWLFRELSSYVPMESDE
ncbi:MAG: sigma-70 family RNA polymerase sigma factor [Phycisphaerales bacterium]